MYNYRKLTSDLYYTGVNDRRIALFENVYPVSGVSYNSYVLLDEKNVIFDTADGGFTAKYLENVKAALGGRNADYLIISHMEPDHSASVKAVLDTYPDVQIVCNAKSLTMLKNFFGDLSFNAFVVTDGQELSVGRHNLKFVFAPMVHWPEVMFTYDLTDKVLFSADAFGSFGALDGNIFSDERSFEAYLPEARRYYTNIVGKYGAQVVQVLNKLKGAEVNLVCPLHGVIWRNDFPKILEKYTLWANYEPEESSAVIAYASVYGNTAEAADILAGMLAERGVKGITVFDVSKTHYSYIISEAFRASNLVFASVTYNGAVFPAMDSLIKELTAHGIKKRTVSVIQNGSWAATSAGKIREAVAVWKDSFVCGDTVSILSSLAPRQLTDLATLADSIVFSMAKPLPEPVDKHIEPQSMFKFSYGLYILTARENGKDNGCVINTAVQLTDNPKRLAIAVNKSNYTCGMLERTGRFNLSVLTEKTPFDIFRHFGFQSGKTVNKFPDAEILRTDNGLAYIGNCTNAVLSAEITAQYDYGSHILFIGELTEGKVLSNIPSVTYAYYFAHIKPVTQPTKKKGYVCKICGYVYEGEPLPNDFICPICKHPASDFEPIK